VNGPRCSGTTKAGKPCRALAGADGLCTAHSGKTDMRELGHRGGKARRKGVAEQLPEAERTSLREQLRRGLDPELVVCTANEILAGENQTARGNMIRFLADLELYRRDGVECPRCAAARAEGPAAREEVYRMIARLVEHAVRAELAGVDEKPENSSQASRLVRAGVRRGLKGHEEWLQDAVESAVGKVLDQIANGLVVGSVVTSEQAEETLRGLEEIGLLVRRGSLEEMAEEVAQQRLVALKQEHGIPA
jgi:hypothetical protein